MARFVAWRRLRRGPVLGVLVVLVLAAGGGIAWAVTRPSSKPNVVQTATAQVGTLQETVPTSGTVATRHTADLDFGVSGRVTHVLVNVGDYVHKGQALARVGVAALKADYEAARATLSAADSAAADDSGSSDAQQASDDAAVTSAKSQLRSARTNVREATLRSTIAGQVTSLDLSKGQEVTGSGSTSSDASSPADSDADDDDNSSSSDVVVSSTKSLEVEANVSDTEIDEIKVGQSASVTPDGAIQAVAGKVTSVGTVPTSSSGTVEFPIVIRIDGHPSGVYAGASADATITLHKLVHVLEIPTLALSYHGSTATVQLVQGNTTVTRTVSVGKSYGLETQIISGLSAGDRVDYSLPTFPGRATSGSTTNKSGITGFPGGGSFTGGFPSGGGLFQGTGGAP